eukprot:6071281-Pleurochrysis_carterae.AAC.1
MRTVHSEGRNARKDGMSTEETHSIARTGRFPNTKGIRHAAQKEPAMRNSDGSKRTARPEQIL